MKVARALSLRLAGIFAISLVILISLDAYPGIRHHKINVIHAVDYNLPYLGDSQLGKVLENVRLKSKQLLNAKVKFKNIKTVDYYKLFSELPDLEDNKSINDYIINSFKKDRYFYREDIYSKSKERQHYGNNKTLSKTEFMTLIDYYFDCIKEIRKFKNLKGKAIYDESTYYYHSYTYLDAYLSNEKSLYNTLIISNTLLFDDGRDIPIHSLRRGGILNGVQFKRNIIVSYFPMIHDDAYFEKRGRVKLNPQELQDCVALMVCHEFGHFIKDYKDLYEDNYSIMYPVNMFEYKKWINSRIKHSPK